MNGSRIAKFVATAALAIGISQAASEAMASGMPISFTTQISTAELRMLKTGITTSNTAISNNMSFSSMLSGGGMSNQRMTVSFSNSNSAAGGAKTSSSNMTLFYGFTGTHYSFTNSFSMVEGSSTSNLPSKSKNLNMGLSIGWPKLPSASIMFTSNSSGAMKNESNQLSMAYSLPKMSFNFNSVETSSMNGSVTTANSRNRSLGATRRHYEGKRLSIGSSLNINRQNANGNQTKGDTLSLNIYDTHIKAAPINLNVNFQKSSQMTKNAPPASSESQNLNMFTAFKIPGQMRVNAAFNTSGSKSPGTPGSSRSKGINLNVSRKFIKRGTVNLTHSITQSAGVKGTNTNLNTSVPVTRTTTVSMQKGTTRSSGSLAPVAPVSFSNYSVTSRLPGGVTSSYQYNVSKADLKNVSQSSNVSIPLTRDVMMTMYTTKKKASGGLGGDKSTGMMASIALSNSMSVSTTWTEQKSKGQTSSVWSMGLMTMLPSRSALTLALTSQNNPDSKSTSMNIGMTMYF